MPQFILNTHVVTVYLKEEVLEDIEDRAELTGLCSILANSSIT